MTSSVELKDQVAIVTGGGTGIGLGIATESRVTVRSATGSLANVLARGWDKIRPGNVLMYYPEANVLVSRAVDPASKTPAFKNVLVTLEPAPVRGKSLPVATSPELLTVAPTQPEGPGSRDQMRSC